MAGINFTDEREYIKLLTFKNNEAIHSVGNHVVCDGCGNTGRGKPTLQEPDGIDCEQCSSK
jgi:hypothetical protein